jgi:hypothetical protein
MIHIITPNPAARRAAWLFQGAYASFLPGSLFLAVSGHFGTLLSVSGHFSRACPSFSIGLSWLFQGTSTGLHCCSRSLLPLQGSFAAPAVDGLEHVADLDPLQVASVYLKGKNSNKQHIYT